MKADVVVIGGGIAGRMVATLLAKKGLTVILVTRGLGATALSSGSFDILGFIDGRLVRNPLEALNRVVTNSPGHVYALLGRGREACRIMCKSLGLFKDMIARYLKIEGTFDKNMILPTVIGTLKPCAYAQETMKSGDVNSFNGEHLLIITLKNLVFHEGSELFERILVSGLTPGKVERISHVSIKASGPSLTCSPLTLAKALDKEKVANRFANETSKILASIPGVTRIAIPPVLGVDNVHVVYEILRENVSLPVFELLSSVPSVPGIRLCRALERMSRDAGVKIMTGWEVMKAHVEGNVVRELSVRHELSGSIKRIAGEDFVIAYGHILGGLQVLDDSVYEPLLGMTLGSITIFTEPFKTLSFALKIGVKVDGDMRVLIGGKPIGNLYACGAALGGVDLAREGIGMGLALSTAYKVFTSLTS